MSLQLQLRLLESSTLSDKMNTRCKKTGEEKREQEGNYRSQLLRGVYMCRYREWVEERI